MRGGARPGAGRKPKKPVLVAQEAPAEPVEPVEVPADPLEFLLAVMRGLIVPTGAQLDAAKAAARFQSEPAGGKKAGRQANAESIVGKFGAAAPMPRLVHSR